MSSGLLRHLSFLQLTFRGAHAPSRAAVDATSTAWARHRARFDARRRAWLRLRGAAERTRERVCSPFQETEMHTRVSTGGYTRRLMPNECRQQPRNTGKNAIKRGWSLRKRQPVADEAGHDGLRWQVGRDTAFARSGRATARTRSSMQKRRGTALPAAVQKFSQWHTLTHR